MRELSVSINSWIFGACPLAEIAQRAKNIGVDGVDISGEPDTVDAKAARRELKAQGLRAFAINGNFTREDRAFCHRDAAHRKSAVEYGKRCVDMALELDTAKVLLVPSQVFRPAPFVSKETDWKNSVEGLRQVADYAAAQGNLTIMLECANKYEVSLVRTLEEGIRMAVDIGRDNVRLVGDTYHMHLEEQEGVHNAIRAAGPGWLAHLHLGDSTREVPGRGSINWREVFIALRDVGYDGAISFEPLPHKLTPDEMAAGVLRPEELDGELAVSLRYLRAVMAAVR